MCKIIIQNSHKHEETRPHPSLSFTKVEAVVQHFIVHHAKPSAAGCLQALPVDPQGSSLLWVGSCLDTWGVQVAHVTNLFAGLSLGSRAKYPRSCEKHYRRFVASCCIVSDKDTLPHCVLGRWLVSSAGWMRGSAEARASCSSIDIKWEQNRRHARTICFQYID